VVTGEAARLTDAFRLTGTVFEGRFEIEREIAEGGFAVVYRARHLALDRPVALKVLKTPRGHGDATRAEFQDRFAAEAKTIARLKHPHIVDVYDFAISPMPNGDNAPWMALEWLEGETLATLLLRRRNEAAGGLPPGAALDLFRPVLQALAFAHTQGIVHRDIKPANIMVLEGEPKPSLQVLDFGIAKIVDAGQPAGSGDTRTDSLPAFTPSYAAPEQVSYSRTGPWTDVHALGLILTELLTNAPPYADSDAHLFEQAMATERPTPRTKGHDVGALEPIIAKALALSPRERWCDAGELLAALEAATVPAAAPASRLVGQTTRPMIAAAAKLRTPVSPVGSRPRRLKTLAFVAGAALMAAGFIAWQVHAQAPRRALPAAVVLPTAAAAPTEPSTPARVEPALPVEAAVLPAAGHPTSNEPAARRLARAKRGKPRPVKTDVPQEPAQAGAAKDLFDDTK
jgi:serine/threonine-protein kinase